MRGYRFLVTPRWLAGHAIVLALAVTMILLGRWQLDVSNAKHFDLQNFGYTLQWWAFTLFGIGMWLKIIRDAKRHRDDPSLGSRELGPARDAPVAYRRYLMPQSNELAARAEDGEQAAYNAYLAGLNRTPEEG